MFEALPVVIPTLRDVARGTLRPATPSNTAATPESPTAAILLDAATLGTAMPRTLYDELELYLQAAGIASLRLHRRGKSALAQMLDILAGVTLLRSRGCQRVILIVAAEGAIPSWERSRAETLAGMLEIVRRHHGGSAGELLTAIEGLVTTIRAAADSVIGVATILVRPAGLAAAPVSAVARMRPFAPPNRPDHRQSPVKSTRVVSASAAVSSSSPPAASPKALAISLRAGDSAMSAVSQLYLWCQGLAKQPPVAAQAPSHAPSMVEVHAPAQQMRERRQEIVRLHADGAAFHLALRWLDEQWSTMVGELGRQRPQSAARILSDEVRNLHAATRRRRVVAQEIHTRTAGRVLWSYFDTSTRLKWLELCQQALGDLRAVLPESDRTALAAETLPSG